LEKKANLQEEIEQLKRAVEVLKKTVKKRHTTLMCRGNSVSSYKFMHADPK
jgi:hypothetical protein